MKRFGTVILGGNVSGEGKTEVNIQINKQHYKAPSDSMTGAELKALASIPAGNKLFREMPGKDPDQVVGDTERIELHNGDRFYDLPPGVVG